MTSGTGSLPRIVVLISGSGTNLQAILDAIADHRIRARVVNVISNRPGVRGLERARDAGVENQVVDHRQFPDRASFDAKLQQEIDRSAPDLVVLAGFMRILTGAFVRHYQGRMLNIHPSLLPLYPGLDTHARAIASGDQWHGATVHFVTEDLDAGPSIIQARVPIVAGESPDTLAERVQRGEHLIYPEAIAWFVDGRLCLADQAALLDGEPLPPGGVQRECHENGAAP